MVEVEKAPGAAAVPSQHAIELTCFLVAAFDEAAVSAALVAIGGSGKNEAGVQSAGLWQLACYCPQKELVPPKHYAGSFA